MIVQCENCETRFHVADARIPEKGARVRCSRCHHRFHITPSSGTSAGPSPAADVSARTATRGDAPAEDELDNPEFLFDGGASESGQTPPRAKGAPRPAPAKQAAAAAPEHEAEPEELKSPSPDLEPAAAPEQHVVETRGKTAQEMLDAGAPKLGSGPVEFAPSLLDPDSDDTRSRVFLGAEGPAAESAPPPSLRPAKDKPARLSPEPDIDAAFGAGASDDEGDSGWDALTKEDPEEPAPPRSVFDAGASFGLVTATAMPIAATPAAAKPARANLFDPAEIQPGDTKKRQAPDAASFDPEAGSPIRGILRVAAVLVGIALLGGALHGLQMQQEASALGTEAEQVAGWIATDVETFVARDSLGVRVLVVRGNLFPNGPAAPPEVDVSLLENDGQRVGEPRRAWLERLDDAEIAPDELSVRLAAHGGELSGAGPQVTGFTALLADPPARARRVQVTLAAGKAPVRGTATAITPRPVTPPAQDSQLAAPESPVERPTPDDAVVPAAPDASD